MEYLSESHSISQDDFNIINKVWSGTNIFILAPLIFVLLWRTYTEFRSEVTDLFKIMQYFSLLFVFGINSLYIILLLAMPSKTIFLLTFSNFVAMNVFYFQLSNQICWATMIIHLKQYK